ncbi:MAG: response regulator transcription factor [Clostridiales Family XIII bacterium]|jgi:DNA-binding response OmpR family regulator|nr:response regulator transcription factor [Clostridiales Family XIII bacterium]
MKLILCVEDERSVLENNRKAFADAGYGVLTAETLAQARQRLSEQTPDGIVLDIMLPDGLGLELLTELREQGSKIPVILLTAWDKPYDVARGLRAGANDYLSKPFDYEVLLARVEAMFRNVEQMPDVIEKGNLTLQMTSMIALQDGVDMLLTQKEFALLLLFARNEGKTLSTEYIYEQVWGHSMNEDPNAVKLQVSRLRTKTEGSGYAILAVRGTGYRFEVRPATKIRKL